MIQLSQAPLALEIEGVLYLLNMRNLNYIILGISPTSFRVFPFEEIQKSVYLCSVNIKKQTIMKKIIFVTMLSLLTMSSCSTYTANGAMTGGMFGAMIGSSIGGLSGGWRGSHIGQVVGMAGGAAVGAAIGAAEEKKQEEKIQQYRREQAQRRAARQRTYSSDDSGFDPTNSGDDRIDLDLPETRTVKPASVKPASVKPAKVKKSTAKQKSQPAKTQEPVDDVYAM